MTPVEDHSTPGAIDFGDELDIEALDKMLREALSRRPQFYTGMNVIVSQYLPKDTLCFISDVPLIGKPARVEYKEEVRYAPFISDCHIGHMHSPLYMFKVTDEAGPIVEPDSRLQMWIGYVLIFAMLISLVLWGFY